MFHLGSDPKVSFPHVSPVGDCEVGATRKACKNCTCGRAEAEAEAEQKVEKLELTAEQIDNPQSACGSVSIVSYSGIRCSNVGECIGVDTLNQYTDISFIQMTNCSVGWVMRFDVVPVHTEASRHSSLERRYCFSSH
jgi:hypothetical protein